MRAYKNACFQNDHNNNYDFISLLVGSARPKFGSDRPIRLPNTYKIYIKNCLCVYDVAEQCQATKYSVSRSCCFLFLFFF